MATSTSDAPVIQRLSSRQLAEARAAATANVSSIADILMHADLSHLVLSNLSARDLSASDATCKALAAVTGASWQQLVEKKWPKIMARPTTRQTSAGMGHRGYFLWRVRNKKEHIKEAFRLALQGDAAGLLQMLDAGKGINGRHPYIGHRQSPMHLRSICGESPGDDGQTVLHAAAWESALEVMKVLLDADGLNLGACTRCGFTPLHYAAYTGDADMCRLLVEGGANHEMGTVVGKYRNGHGMPVDNARGEAKAYLQSLNYVQQQQQQQLQQQQQQLQQQQQQPPGGIGPSPRP